MCRSCKIVTRYTHVMVVCCLHHPHHLHQVFILMLSLPNITVLYYSSLSSPSPNMPQCVIFPSLCLCVLIAQHPLMSDNMHYLFFCSCVSLLRMMVFRFIHVPAKDMNSSLFMAIYYSMVYVCHIFFIQSFIDIWVGSKSLLL